MMSIGPLFALETALLSNNESVYSFPDYLVSRPRKRPGMLFSPSISLRSAIFKFLPVSLA